MIPQLTPEDRDQIAAVVKAMAEDSAVYRANEPTRERNAIARANNDRIRATLDKPLEPAERKRLAAQLRPLESPLHRTSNGSRAILLAESRARRRLDAVTDRQWVARIEALDKSFRVTVACIVWWDYFGARDSSHHADALDAYLDKRVSDIPEETIAACLIKCGYTPFQAIQRAQCDASESAKQKECAA